jgi:hypothetical protein
VPDPARITPLAHPPGRPRGQTESSQHLPQEHNPAIRRQHAAIKCGTGFSAGTGWQSERQSGILVNGGRGTFSLGEELA